MLRLRYIALGLTVGVPVASGGNVLSSSTLESCTTTSSGLTANFCDTRLAILYSVVSGQNDTDAIELMLNEVQQDDQPVAAIASHELVITIRKTPIYFQYPTTYDRTYNYQAYELVGYGTTESDGTFTYFNDNPLDFQALNTCIDSDDAESPSCGFAVDSNGERIPYSQGRCCSCSFLDYVVDSGYTTRANLACSLDDAAYSSSAHCLRFDPLFYHAYTVGTPSTYYAILVQLTKCPADSSSDGDEGCTSSTVVLSPSTIASTSSDGLFHASIVGDLATFEDAPTFSDKYLAVPAGTTDDDCSGATQDPRRPGVDLSARCITHLSYGPEYWMLLDRYLFQGSESNCNTFSVDYQSFRFSTDFCDVPVDSCTSKQMADFFDDDLDKYLSGEQGRYFTMFQGSLGLSNIYLAEGLGATKMQQGLASGLLFESDRLHTTLLHMEVAADDLQFVTNVANGKILSYDIATFAEGSNSGRLSVTYENTDAGSAGANAQFTLSIQNCSSGVTAPGAVVSSVAGGATETDVFNIKSASSLADLSPTTSAHHHCEAVLASFDGTIVDSVRIDFDTTQTVTQRSNGNGGGTIVTNGPSAEGSDVVDLLETCLCSFGEVMCYLSDQEHCMTEVLVVLGLVAAAVGLVFFCCCCCCCCKKCIKFICCCPCSLAKAIVKCCKKYPCWTASGDHESSDDEEEETNHSEATPNEVSKLPNKRAQHRSPHHHHHRKHHRRGHRKELKSAAIVPVAALADAATSQESGAPTSTNISHSTHEDVPLQQKRSPLSEVQKVHSGVRLPSRDFKDSNVVIPWHLFYEHFNEGDTVTFSHSLQPPSPLGAEAKEASVVQGMIVAIEKVHRYSIRCDDRSTVYSGIRHSQITTCQPGRKSRSIHKLRKRIHAPKHLLKKPIVFLNVRRIFHDAWEEIGVGALALTSLPTRHFSIAGYLDEGLSPGTFRFHVRRGRKQYGDWQTCTVVTDTRHHSESDLNDVAHRQIVALHPPRSFASLGLDGVFDIPSMSLSAAMQLVSSHPGHGFVVLNGTDSEHKELRLHATRAE